MTTKPNKTSLPPRLQKRQNALGKNPLGKLLSKIPGLKSLTRTQQKKVDQTLSSHKRAALEKATLNKTAKTLPVKPQKLAVGGAAKVRLEQVNVKGVGTALKTSPKPKGKS